MLVNENALLWGGGGGVCVGGGGGVREGEYRVH